MKKILPFLMLFVGLSAMSDVQAQCKADFSYTTNGSGTFVFIDSSGARYTTDDWTFGDGTSTSSTSGQVTHTYNATGNFTVCRMVWDSAISCRDTFCERISFTSANCKALFTFTVSGDTVQFSDNSTNAVYHSWDFADGTSSKSVNPVHIYSRPGTYSVCLTIIDSVRTCIDKYCLTVTVASKCDASWTATSQLLVTGFRLNNFKTGRISYKWTFGDGDSSNQANPVHTYKKSGTYMACLELFDTTLNCFDRYCDSLIVDTTNTTRCSANFSATVTNDTLVQLTNWSTGLTNFKWYFPSGGTSTNRHESIVIKKPGTYTICLAGRDSVSGCEDSICKTVKIDSAKNCQASFRVAVDTSQKFKLFLINSSSNKSTHAYSWSFGDGTSSTKRNPTHKYKSFGRYLVCLSITDSTLNCTSTYCDSLGLDSNGRLLKADGFEIEVIDDFVSVPKTQKVDFAIYPNPFSSRFTVRLNGAIKPNANVKLFNMQGRLVSSKSMDQAGKASINLDDEVNGLYVIRIFDGEHFVQTKVMKMNR